MHNFKLNNITIHGYSVRGTYRFLTSFEEPMNKGANFMVWHKSVPSKASLFTCRLLQDKIPTKTNLERRGVLQPMDNYVSEVVVTLRQRIIYSLDAIFLG